MTLKLISVNIERSKHLDLVLPFIERERPDVLCVQELVERDIEPVAAALGAAAHVFAPTSLHPAEVELAVEGVGMFSRTPFSRTSVRYYRGGAQELIPMRLDEKGNPTDTEHDMNCSLALAELAAEGEIFRIGTTHFTWSQGGRPTDAQRSDMRALASLLEAEKEFVLCGDFNAPRGGEIFAMLASRYTDNIPPQYMTSLDKTLHRAGDLQLMVDGLFSTAAYECSDVRLVSGISDHMAVVAHLKRT